MGGQQRLVHAVPRHQLLRLGAQGLRLLRVPGRLGLGEQRADPAEHARLAARRGPPGLAGVVQRFQGGQPQQQPVQLQYGCGVREAVGAVGTGGTIGAVAVGGTAGAVGAGTRGAGGRLVRSEQAVELSELGGPAPAARPVGGGLRADEPRHEPYVCLVQLPPHDAHDIGRLPPSPPRGGHQLLAPPREFGIRRRVGGEQGGARVEGVVGGGVQRDPKGALDGAGRTGRAGGGGAGGTHAPIVP